MRRTAEKSHDTESAIHLTKSVHLQRTEAFAPFLQSVEGNWYLSHCNAGWDKLPLKNRGSQRQRAQMSPAESHLERPGHKMSDKICYNYLQRGVWDKQS